MSLVSSIPCLSVRQPWAHWIIYGDARGVPETPIIKDVENRTWCAPKQYWGKDLAIHASKTPDYKDELTDEMKFGGVIGIVRLVECVQGHSSDWAEPDQYQWVLANPRPIEFIEMKGRLGVFHVDGRLVKELKQ